MYNILSLIQIPVSGTSTANPYVKLYLLPDPYKSTKRKTKVTKKTLHPTYNETVSQYYNDCPYHFKHTNMHMHTHTHTHIHTRIHTSYQGLRINHSWPQRLATSEGMGMEKHEWINYSFCKCLCSMQLHLFLHLSELVAAT